MLTETGRVVAVESDSLWVETLRRSTCGSCSARKGCGHGLMQEMGGGRSNFVRALARGQDTSRYQVGDTVTISIPEQLLLRGSFILYVLPLLGILAGVLLAETLVGGDLAAVAGAATGFGIGLIAVRWHARRHRDDSDFQPVLLGPSPREAALISTT